MRTRTAGRAVSPQPLNVKQNHASTRNVKLM